MINKIKDDLFNDQDSRKKASINRFTLRFKSIKQE